MSPLTARASWKALQARHEKIRALHLRTPFADDATRGERLTAEASSTILAERLTPETLGKLDLRDITEVWRRAA